MSLIGKEHPLPERVLESGGSEVKEDDIREQLRKEEDELSRERRKWELANSKKLRDAAAPTTPVR